MKQKLTYLILFLILGHLSVNAQCITKYPYSYDFENFDSFQTDASCTLTIKGDSADGWYQDTSDFGEWRVDSAGTGSFSTGPGSKDGESGIGVGTDYSPGTTSGVYLYTEASGCSGTEVNLLSPCFDLSGTSYYQFDFAYNMHGNEAMGSLSVDVYHKGAWDLGVWTINGDQGEGWKIAQVKLAKYKGSSVQLRLRAVTGPSFTSDIAIDAVSVHTYTPVNYDAAIVGAVAHRDPTHGYNHIPKNQADSIYYSVHIKNEGLKDVTGVKLIVDIPSRSDTFSYGTLPAFTQDSLTNFVVHLPSNSDNDTATIRLLLNEKDANTGNNELVIENYHSDSVYSRDNGNWFNGVGSNAGTVEIGNVYELKTDDSLTSVSFFISGGFAGDSVVVNLYDFSAGVLGSLIASSKNIVMDGSTRWYTVSLGCPQDLKKGEYFLAVRQLVANRNMGLGYSQNFYVNGSCKFSGAGWPDLVLNGEGATVMVRMNFGEVRKPDLSVDLADSICRGVQYVVTASGAETYAWEPSGIVQSKVGEVVKVQANSPFTLKLEGTDKCGEKSVLQKDIYVKELPKLNVSNDTIICENQPVVLKASTTNPYRWVNGTANGNYSVNPSKSTIYKVVADSSNGCSRERSVQVTVNKPVPMVNNDTSLCEAQPLRLEASGGKTYQWVGGPATAVYNVRPRQTGNYIVEVRDSTNCVAIDTVHVSVTPGPVLTTSQDTAVCFGTRAQLSASGADSYQWDGGPATANYNALPISSKTYYVKGTAANGCFIVDSVHVTVAKVPSLTIRNDTTICEGNTLDITANTSDDVQFDWSNGDTTKTIMVSPNVTTTYKVFIANSTGCSAEDSIRLSVDPLPFMDFNMTQSHKNITVLNYSKHGDSHLWKFGDGDSSSDRSVTHRYKTHGTYTVSYVITNKCGSKDTTFIIDVENLGVEGVALKKFNVYPNPTQGELVVDFESKDLGPVTIQLLDINGRVVFHKMLDKTGSLFRQTLDLSEVSKGTYTLSVDTLEGGVTKKIIVH